MYIKWNQLYENFNLHQQICKPTRIITNSETLIDHIYVTTKVLPKYVSLCVVVVTTYLFALHGLKRV